MLNYREVRFWPKAARPFTGENRKKRTFRRSLEDRKPVCREEDDPGVNMLVDGSIAAVLAMAEMPYAGCLLSRTADSF